MKPLVKLTGLSAWHSLLLLLIFAGSCTNIYFEQPVPQGGKALDAFPADWTGVYKEEKEHEEGSSVYVDCIRFERLSETQLLVSGETRIAQKDMTGFRADLEAQKKSGKLIDYLLTERFLMTTIPVDDESRIGITAEQRVAPLFKEGNWYILGKSPEPMLLFDLKATQLTRFESQGPSEGGDGLFSQADSLSSELIRLAARQKDGGFYFNLFKNDNGLWEVYYLTQPAKGEMLVKTSVLKDDKDFEQRLDFYKGITPFAKLEGRKDYKIAPTDQALGRLIADENLLQTTRLKKISDK